MSLFQIISKAIAKLGIAAITLCGIAYFSGARINTTHSIPLGLYWLSVAPVAKGEYVIFCPPQVEVFKEAKARGYITHGMCPGDFGYMMKRVLGVKDDVIDVTDAAVTVNGVALPFSTRKEVDKAGRPMGRFQSSHYVLSDNELLLMTDVSPNSFDARYFGPVSRNQVVSVIRPVFLWSN